MGHREEDRYEFKGIKIAHEFIVDILGGLIPGALFLFNIILCVVFPLVCYAGPNNNFRNLTTDGNWFWVIAFLSFLILSYVIGHIFYRADIKQPDRMDIRREQKKKLMQLIDTLNRFGKNVTRKKKHVQSALADELDALIGGLEELQQSDQLNTKPYTATYLGHCKNARKLLESASGPLDPDFNESILKVLFPELIDKDLIHKGNNTDHSIASTLFKGITTLPDDITRTIGHMAKICPAMTNPPHNNLLMRIYVNLTWTYIHYRKRYKPGILPADKTQKSTDTLNLNKLIVCYLILHMQTESACATEERCDFPYISYYKYLLKRRQSHLLPYVKWVTKAERTKNQLNRYKIKLQLAIPEAYSIISKNESHIRMASSSWHVARVVRGISVFMLATTLMIAFAGIVSAHNNTMIRLLPLLKWTTEDNLLLAVLFPTVTICFTHYIILAIPRFIHYQRLREIFYTLEVYCVWDNSRLHHNGIDRLKVSQ